MCSLGTSSSSALLRLSLSRCHETIRRPDGLADCPAALSSVSLRSWSAPVDTLISGFLPLPPPARRPAGTLSAPPRGEGLRLLPELPRPASRPPAPPAEPRNPPFRSLPAPPPSPLAHRSPLTVLPGDPVILTMIARGTPHRAVQPVEQNPVDRPRGPLLELERIPHLL